jgi:predicted adenylyl cyclase CyaB
VPSLRDVRDRAAALAADPPQRVVQRDTFFAVPHGRLKVREMDGRAELIAYDRPNHRGLRTSSYSRVPCADPAALVEALARVLPRRGVVVKRREVFLAGRTRIHLDEVEGLGAFVELEVVLADGEPDAAGETEARELMTRLGIDPDALVAEAYIDLIDPAPEA